RGRRLVVPEGDRRRAREELVERRAERVGGSDLHEPVLDDLVGHVLLAQAAPDLTDLLDGEAAVLRDDERPAVRQLLAQLRHGLALGLGRHGGALQCWRAAGARRWAPGSATRNNPCDGRPDGRWPRPAGIAPTREGGSGPASAC